MLEWKELTLIKKLLCTISQKLRLSPLFSAKHSHSEVSHSLLPVGGNLDAEYLNNHLRDKQCAS